MVVVLIGILHGESTVLCVLDCASQTRYVVGSLVEVSIVEVIFILEH